MPPSTVRSISRRVGLPASFRKAVLEAWRRTRRIPLRSSALPGLVVVGAARSGTSSIYSLLREQPGLSPSLRKEVAYFSRYYDKGEGWYRSHFRKPSGCVPFEATPGYYFLPFALERMARDLPDVRLLFLLRDPLERAMSEWRHNVDVGTEDLSFPDALAAEADRTTNLDAELAACAYDRRTIHFAYLRRSQYLAPLHRMHALFGTERVMVLESERFFAAPVPYLAAVREFVGLPPGEIRVPAGDLNVSARPSAGPATDADAGERLLDSRLRREFEDARRDWRQITSDWVDVKVRAKEEQSPD